MSPYNNSAEQEIHVRNLTEGILKFIRGDYPNPKKYRPNKCPHGNKDLCWWCNFDYFTHLLMSEGQITEADYEISMSISREHVLESKQVPSYFWRIAIVVVGLGWLFFPFLMELLGIFLDHISSVRMWRLVIGLPMIAVSFATGIYVVYRFIEGEVERISRNDI